MQKGMLWNFLGALAAVLMLGLPAGAQGQRLLDVAKTPSQAGPAPTGESPQRVTEILIELAWLADPATFPYFLEARAEGTRVEIHGTVPNRQVRERAVFLARLHGSTNVVDALRENPALAARAEAGSAEQLHRAAVTALRQSFPLRGPHLQIQCGADGKVQVFGYVQSFEEKLAVSQALRRLHGCTAAANRLDVATPNPVKTVPSGPGATTPQNAIPQSNQPVIPPTGPRTRPENFSPQATPLPPATGGHRAAESYLPSETFVEGPPPPSRPILSWLDKHFGARPARKNLPQEEIIVVLEEGPAPPPGRPRPVLSWLEKANPFRKKEPVFSSQEEILPLEDPTPLHAARTYPDPESPRPQGNVPSAAPIRQTAWQAPEANKTTNFVPQAPFSWAPAVAAGQTPATSVGGQRPAPPLFPAQVTSKPLNLPAKPGISPPGRVPATLPGQPYVTRGIVVMEEAPAPRPTTAALVSAQWKQRLGALCGNAARVEDVKFPAFGKIQIDLVVFRPQEADRLAERILSLPELQPYQAEVRWVRTP